MSCCTCTCGNNCQPGCGCLYQVVLPDNPISLYSAANINTLGIGVYDSTEGTEFDFRGIYSGNSSIVVALDAGNNAISLTLNVDQIIDDLPQATTTQRGVGETATDAEAIAKASITTFLTPSNLAALGSSTTFAGLVELATDAETQTGTSVTLAVTPAGLASVVDPSAFFPLPQWFDDAAVRAGATPDFQGQFGGQASGSAAFISFGTGVGEWTPILTLGTANTMLGNTTLDPGGLIFTVSGAGSFVIDGTGFNVQNNISIFDNGIVRIGTGGATIFDWALFTVLQINGNPVPANSVLTTTAAGTPTSALKSAFVSTFNTQTGWAVTNPSVTRTLDVAAATLGDVRAVLGTLINDLKAVLLPAT